MLLGFGGGGESSSGPRVIGPGLSCTWYLRARCSTPGGFLMREHFLFCRKEILLVRDKSEEQFPIYFKNISTCILWKISETIYCKISLFIRVFTHPDAKVDFCFHDCVNARQITSKLPRKCIYFSFVF